MRKYWCPLTKWKKHSVTKKWGRETGLINFSQSPSEIPAYLCELSYWRAARGRRDAPLSDLLLLSRSPVLLCKAAHWEAEEGSPKTPTRLSRRVRRAQHPFLLCRAAAEGEQLQPPLPGTRSPGQLPGLFPCRRTLNGHHWTGPRGLFGGEGFTETCSLAGLCNGLVSVSLTKVYAGINGSWVNLPGLFKTHSV